MFAQPLAYQTCCVIYYMCQCSAL